MYAHRSLTDIIAQATLRLSEPSQSINFDSLYQEAEEIIAQFGLRDEERPLDNGGQDCLNPAESEIARLFVRDKNACINTEAGKVTEDGYKSLLERAKRDKQALSLSPQASGVLESLELADFKRIIRQARVLANLDKNNQKGFAITIVTGLPFGKNNPHYQQFLRLVERLRERIREITGAQVRFNEQEGIDALHMTIQAITRTKNFEAGNEESMRQALDNVKGVVAAIQANLHSHLPRIYEALEQALNSSDKESIRQKLEGANQIAQEAIDLRKNASKDLKEDIFGEIKEEIKDLLSNLDGLELSKIKERLKSLKDKAYIQIGNQQVTDLTN
jgi:hypothetical protein